MDLNKDLLTEDQTEYLHTQDLVIGICEVTNKLHLDSFLSKINKAEAIAPILDPTLFNEGNDSLSKIKAIATKLLELKELGIEFNSY